MPCGTRQVSGSKRLVSRMAAPEPNVACMVCGTAQAELAIDTNKMTLQQLVDRVRGGQIGFKVKLDSFLDPITTRQQQHWKDSRRPHESRSVAGAEGAAGVAGTDGAVRNLQL